MLGKAAALALVIALLGPAVAFADQGHHHGHHGPHGRVFQDRSDSDYGNDDDSDVSDPGDDSNDSDSATDATPASAGGTVSSGAQQSITAEITGYSYQDNTPPGSAEISMPVLHSKAGGTGTYADPITTAVPGGAGNPETAKGTRIYVAKLKRYFIVEDSGASKASSKHFDLYVDGAGFSKSDSDACMNSYTGSAQVILNPPAGEPVTVGALTQKGGCKL